jgi:ABC-2 type transport system ATP-binding protein
METIQTEQMRKAFNGKFRLGPLDLRVAPGEILGVMGPEGAGKTTLLRLLWGLLRPDKGSISIFGMEPHKDYVDIRLRAGYVWDIPYLYPALAARQFLLFIGSFYDSWQRRRTFQLLDEFGIDADGPIGSLSKSDRMKLLIVSAVGHRPSLLMLDEPTSGLDPAVRIDILDFLRRLAREENTSIVITSQIGDDLDHLAESILMLKEGSVIEYARASDLLIKYKQSRLEGIFEAFGTAHDP